MSSRKKKTKKRSSESTPILSLPDDLLLSCISRVSRLYYPTLSLVSKSFRSLIASPELYKTRSFLNHTESCFYVCLEFPPEPNQRWFTLCRKPNQRWFTLCRKPNKTLTNKKKKKSSGYFLVPVPNSPPAHCNGLVAVGSNIYAIGGSNRYSSSVSILDCRSHKWHKAPSMRIERNYAAANVVDGRIYVAGGLEEEDCNDSNWMEVFDTKTQTWELVVSPLADSCVSRIYYSAVIEGKIYLFGHKGVAYKPKEDRWIAIRQNQDFDLAAYPYCVVDNVMYCYLSREIQWYESEVRYWIKLKGLEGLPKFASYSTVKLAACGGKLVVLWDKNVPGSGYKEKMIWCAEISLEKRDNEDIWGKVEWFDAVLTVPKSYKFVSTLAITV